MAIDEPNAQNIVYLVERLRAAHQLTWEEVESLLADFPGWLRGAQLLREKGAGFRDLYDFSPPPDGGLYVSHPVRELLLKTFQPYALLLCGRYKPSERMTHLQEAGVNVEQFCRECLHNDCATVVTAATEVLDACDAEQTLLRMASKHFQDTGSLLRTPSQTSDDETLLNPAAEPSEPSNPPRRSWLQKLLGR